MRGVSDRGPGTHEFPSAENEVERQAEVGHQREGDDPCDRRGRVAPLALRMRGDHVNDQPRKHDDAVQ